MSTDLERLLTPIMNDQTAILCLVADRMNAMEDGVAKLLGGRAAELLPALAGGNEALLKARAGA